MTPTRVSVLDCDLINMETLAYHVMHLVCECDMHCLEVVEPGLCGFDGSNGRELLQAFDGVDVGGFLGLC